MLLRNTARDCVTVMSNVENLTSAVQYDKLLVSVPVTLFRLTYDRRIR